MNIDINKEAMYTIMNNFYISTGITIVLFDALGQQPVLTVPAEPCKFCQLMKEHSSTSYLCQKSDTNAINICKEKNTFIIYYCHAGLAEACAPLIINETVIGYFMFGQISECPDPEELNKHLHDYVEKQFHISVPEDLISDIAFKNTDQIKAAACIMDSLAQYSIHSESIRIHRHNFSTNMNAFLLARLSEDLSADLIAHELGISRSKLYQACNEYLGKGIAAYLLELRINQAKLLLRTTDIPVCTIAEKCGFHDYNYFCRVYKKETGSSAGNYRRENQQSHQ